MLRGSLVFLVTLMLSVSLKAQTEEVCKWVSEFDSEVILDSLTVYPESVRITKPNSKIQFEFNLNTNSILIPKQGVDSVLVCYRTLPFDLHTPKANRTLDIYDSTALFKDAVLYQEALALPTREEVISTESITKTGSITRGVSFGNRQDVFVNSTLNLQMEGQLTESVNLRAVITDRNVPFQPEGNTQQLQDFDNVFIELYNDKFSLKAGDVVLRNQESNFLRYYKNVQGAQFKVDYDLPNGFKAQTSLAASVAKGRFASTTIDPIEGVLGPYRVRGPQNERFLIILAGSEKVFIDGEQKTRGFENDYIIDYNLGEITFTNKVLITQFTRIRVDFEFSDQNYTRSIFQASHYQQNDKLNFSLNYYSEKDNRNQPLAFDLSNEEKRILADAGDNLDQAFTSRVDSIGFTPDLILYRRTVGSDANNQTYDIFQYSTNPDSAFFDVQFSDVGFMRGNYRLLSTTSNGRIYEWIPPVNGVAQGNFEPISILNAPNQKSMFTVGGSAKLNSHDVVEAEIALSQNDLNLFSEVDSEDDNGTAFKLIHRTTDRQVQFLPKYLFNSELSYEYNSESFSFIDRLRYIEFDRDWSFNPNDFAQSFSENILNAKLNLTKDPLNSFDYRLVRRKRGEAVDGFQHYFNFSKRIGRLQTRLDAYLMNNDQAVLSSEWNRLKFDVSYGSRWFIPGYRYQQDRNAVRSQLDNLVVSTAMNFSEHTFYLKNADTLKTTYGIDYQVREDRLPVNGVLLDNNQSETWNAFFRTNFDDNNRLSLLFTYRNLENLNESGIDRNDETIMGRLDWVGSFFDRIVRSELNYNLSNSRELRREFIFILVATGQGTHTWRDDNGDGIQDLNEFYLAINPDEKNYAKIFVPTDTFEEAFNTIISYRFNLNFPRVWNRETGFKKFISHFSNNTAWSLNSKIIDDDLGSRLLPTNVPDSVVLGLNESVRSTLFFNRSNTKFGADIGIAQIQNKQLLLNGFERRANRDIRTHLRWNINKSLNLDINYIDGNRSNSSDVLEPRNYQIEQTTFQPSITWQPFRTFRFTGKLSQKEKQNVFSEGNGESAMLRELEISMRFAKAAKTTLTSGFRLVNIDFVGTENTPTGYELLEALRPGQNFTWNVNWQQKLGKGLQLVLRYDGRKSADNSAVHLGRVQVSALF
ncbi:hypothetical protein [Roseivirga sp. E12]|uniref:hypothetical protein n=1 Tax=Roseivirga sp. E12 TaxID=2819237 RepID=UPI001ABC7871|nr:hypothetical protein [Roseivirga sp. E12]MBO3698464.1 hypothetical protein [Roseivirga sp. E12]